MKIQKVLNISEADPCILKLKVGDGYILINFIKWHLGINKKKTRNPLKKLIAATGFMELVCSAIFIYTDRMYSLLQIF